MVLSTLPRLQGRLVVWVVGEGGGGCSGDTTAPPPAVRPRTVVSLLLCSLPRSSLRLFVSADDDPSNPTTIVSSFSSTTIRCSAVRLLFSLRYVDNGVELGVPVMAPGAALWSDERSGAMSSTTVEGETHNVRAINDDSDWG
ncbi:hypothetical protein U1Q18_029230 [Sarracenia purpurea var. burkii]